MFKAFQDLDPIQITLPWFPRAVKPHNHVVPRQYRSKILDMIVGGLVTSSDLSSPIKALKIRNLSSRHDHLTEREGFSRLLGRLSTLELTIWMQEKDVLESRDHIELRSESLGFLSNLSAIGSRQHKTFQP